MMKALVLAGGSGKEMLPLSKHCPKTMLLLHDKHVIEYVLEGLIETGIDEFIVVIGHQGHLLLEVVEKYRENGINIQTVDQGENVGIEGAILSASPFLDADKPFLLAYGDIIAPSMFYHHLLNSFINTAADGTIAVTLIGKSEEFGIASIDDRGFISKISPDPASDDSGTNYIFAGASILPGEFIEILTQEKKLTDSLSRLLKEQRRICASVWQDEWIDVGYGWDLIAANQDIFKGLNYSRIHKSAKISPSAHVSGLVLIEDGVVIDHNAEIVGPVFIGKNAYIGTNSLIRDHSYIGKGSTIGFSVEVKNSVIQPKCKIGRLSFVGDSVIGENTLIGSGVTTMNVLRDKDMQRTPQHIKGREYHKLGVIIGPNSVIGSNSVIKPYVVIDADQDIPDGSVVKRNVSEKDSS
ncbi:MAG: sugar phosphate nucleotidyltransferase [Candidatus Kariarchaeaceae archaeon]|jgi:NDP-sugar pyrophosphorylase family protein